MATISASVGKGGVNNKADVTIVQHLLNAHVRSMGLAILDEDGRIGDNTTDAIARYQQMVLGNANPDGRIDVGGGTWKSLVAGTVGPAAGARKPAASQLSGADWWHANQADFRTAPGLPTLPRRFGRGRCGSSPRSRRRRARRSMSPRPCATPPAPT